MANSPTPDDSLGEASLPELTGIKAGEPRDSTQLKPGEPPHGPIPETFRPPETKSGWTASRIILAVVLPPIVGIACAIASYFILTPKGPAGIAEDVAVMVYSLVFGGLSFMVTVTVIVVLVKNAGDRKRARRVGDE